MGRVSRSTPVAGDFIRFEVRDGIRRVSCTVANDALEAVSGLTGPSSSVLRRKSFDRFRTLIDAAAQLKLRTLPAGSPGPLTLDRHDLRVVPPEKGVPSFGSSARPVVRPPSPASPHAPASATAAGACGDDHG